MAKHKSAKGREIGARVRALRKATGFRQEQVAERGGIRREEVSNAELGRNLVSTDRMLQGLAKGLGVTADALRSYLDGELPLDAVQGSAAPTVPDGVLVLRDGSPTLFDAKRRAVTILVRDKGIDDVDYARELVEATVALEHRLGPDPVPPDADAIAETALDIARARSRLRRGATDDEIATLGLDRPPGPERTPPKGTPPSIGAVGPSTRHKIRGSPSRR